MRYLLIALSMLLAGCGADPRGSEIRSAVFANGQLRSYMRTPVKCVVLATSASRSHSLFVSFYVAQLLSANG